MCEVQIAYKAGLFDVLPPFLVLFMKVFKITKIPANTKNTKKKLTNTENTEKHRLRGLSQFCQTFVVKHQNSSVTGKSSRKPLCALK